MNKIAVGVDGNKENNSGSVFLSMVFFLALFIPHSNNVQMSMQIGMLFFLGVSLKSMRISGFLYKAAFLPFLFCFIISFLINILDASTAENKDIFMNFYIFLLLLLFPFNKNIKPMHSLVFIISIFYIFISQISYVFNIPLIIDYFEKFYSYQGDMLGYQSDFVLSGAGDMEFISNRRYGGLFHNPNQAMKYMTLLYLGALLFWVEKNIYKFSIVSLIVFSSIILSGSRTALFIYVIVSFIYIFPFLKKANKKSITIFFLVIMFVIYGAIKITSGFQSERAFLVGEGLSNSVGVKLIWLQDTLEQMDVSKLLFGHFWRSSFTDYNVLMLDSEWGYLIFDYGIVGFLTWIFSLIYLFYKCPKRYRLIFIFLLWSISSTVLMSYRTSFVFFMLLGSCLLISDPKVEKKNT